ncbi:MAG TPA: hypothetical protein VG755_14495 [Nannocystaceae bacterium]|nr:hypothetical protein [Nannocystaceae bacterium]
MDEAERRAPAQVRIEIGALELDGFPAERRFAIADACTRELVRLFERGSPATLGNAGSDAGRDERQTHARFAANDPPEAVGIAIARAAFAALRPRGDSVIDGSSSPRDSRRRST